MKNILTPDGTNDILFTQSDKLAYITDQIRHQFCARGYKPVATPTIEFYDLFMSGSRKFNQNELYAFSSKNGRLVVLRPDSTLPIARLVTTKLKNNGELLKLFYMQPIFMSNSSHGGKEDETLQAGVELIGDSSFASDIEIIVLASNAIKQFTNKFTIEIGHVGIYNYLIDKICEDTETKNEIREILLAKNHSELQDALISYSDNKYAKLLLNLPRMFGGKEVLEEAKIIFNNENINNILQYLSDLYDKLNNIGIAGNVTIDLGVLNHNDYYTGLTFKAYIDNVGEEVAGGGRYDNLMKEFDRDLPAIGFGINLNKLSTVVEAPSTPQTKLIVCDTENIHIALELQDKLIEQGYYVTTMYNASQQKYRGHAAQNNISEIYLVTADNVKSIKL